MRAAAFTPPPGACAASPPLLMRPSARPAEASPSPSASLRSRTSRLRSLRRAERKAKHLANGVHELLIDAALHRMLAKVLTRAGRPARQRRASVQALVPARALVPVPARVPAQTQVQASEAQAVARPAARAVAAAVPS